MLPIKNKFTYQKISRVDVDGQRLYNTPSGPLPSVTTILSKTKDQSGLDAWRTFVGDKKADSIVKVACDVGTLLHSCLENYILGREQCSKNNLIHKIANKMAEKVIDLGLSTLSFAYGIEAALYYEGLYAGTTDLIAEYKNEVVIVDYKNSKKIKDEKYLEDYYIQLVAYGMAHDSMFNTNITKALIFMVTRPNEKTCNLNDIEYKTFILEGDEYQKYKSKWIARLEQYYQT